MNTLYLQQTFFCLTKQDNKNPFEEVNYKKYNRDGKTFADKYNSKMLKIRSPDVVFSNHPSEFHKMSEGRWKVFFIENDELSSNCEKFAMGRLATISDFESDDEDISVADSRD